MFDKGYIKTNRSRNGSEKVSLGFNSFKRNNMLNSEQILNSFLVREEVTSNVTFLQEKYYIISHLIYKQPNKKLDRNYALYLNHTYSAFTRYFAGV